MVCSCGYSNIYKKVPQGKSIQEWIKRNPEWVKTFGINLLAYCYTEIKIKIKQCLIYLIFFVVLKGCAV